MTQFFKWHHSKAQFIKLRGVPSTTGQASALCLSDLGFSRPWKRKGLSVLKAKKCTLLCPWPKLWPTEGGGEVEMVPPTGAWEGHQGLLPFVRGQQSAGCGGGWELASLAGHPSSSGGEPRGLTVVTGFSSESIRNWLRHPNAQWYRHLGSTPGGAPNSRA